MAAAEQTATLPQVVGGREQDRRPGGALATLERRAPWVLAGLIAVDLVLLLHTGRGLTFFYDEWDFVQRDYGGGWHVLVTPHVGNIVFFPAIAYKVLFHVAGLNHYWVFRLTVIGLHLISGGLVYVLAARRTSRVGALLAAALVLFMGAAWEDLLWPFQIGYLLAIASGLGAWVLIERDDRLGDLGATACLVLSIGSASLGIPVAVGIFVELAWRRQARRLWVLVLPVALYVAWYLAYGESEVTSESLLHAPGYVADLAAAAAGALVGRGLEWGRPLALFAGVLLIVRLIRPLPVSPRLAGMIAAAVSLWVVTAVARSTISVPETSRYVYLGVVAIVLIGVELAATVDVSPRAIGVAGVLVVYAALTGLTALDNGAQGLRSTSSNLRVELGAVELAATHALPNFRPDPVRAPTLEAGPYLHTVHSIGSSPAADVAEIKAAPPEERAAVDQTLLSIYSPQLVLLGARAGASSGAPAPAILSLGAGVPSRQGSCETFARPLSGPITAILSVPGGKVLAVDRGTTPLVLTARRFGEQLIPVGPPLAAKASAEIVLPPDRDPTPWQLQVQSTSPLSVCGVGP